MTPRLRIASEQMAALQLLEAVSDGRYGFGTEKERARCALLAADALLAEHDRTRPVTVGEALADLTNKTIAGQPLPPRHERTAAPAARTTSAIARKSPCTDRGAWRDEQHQRGEIEMNRYWDLSEKDRAMLSEEDVKALLQIEAMVEGIVMPEPPPPITPQPTLERVTRYSVYLHGSKIVFETAAQAEAFLDLNPSLLTNDYRIGYRIDFPRPIEPDAVKVVPIEVPTQETVEHHRSQLEAAKQAADAREKQASEYQRMQTKAQKLYDGVWEDWHNRTAQRRRAEKVLATFVEYYTITGDPDMAATFLRKAYSDEEIATACEWAPDRGVAGMPADALENAMQRRIAAEMPLHDGND